MRSLEARLSRLEKQRQAKKHRALSPNEYWPVQSRQQVRRLYNAELKLYRMTDKGEDRLWNSLSDWDREMLENDTPEQQARDEEIEERWRQVHGPSDEEIAAHAEECRRKLRAMKPVAEEFPEAIRQEVIRWEQASP
jgi:hypothetical protein